LLPIAIWGGAAAGARAATCRPRVAEKVGVRFVEVCAGENQAPFWISLAPMPCSAGEHETVDCPSVTPLLAGESPGSLTSRRVAVVEAFTAHRLCGLRFAGHVATRSELKRARAVLGLTAVVVAEPPAPAAEFRFGLLPEWTADGECDNPTSPGSGCRFARWPNGAVGHAPMAEIRACDARVVGATEPARTSVEVGGACAARDWSWSTSRAGEPQVLPCQLHLPDEPAESGVGANFALSCRTPDAQPSRAPLARGSLTAAFRCVVPTAGLAISDDSLPLR
jgi:hypothetical protein